jgi:hypothetical protein
VHGQHIPFKREVVASPVDLAEGDGRHLHHQITVGASVTGGVGGGGGAGIGSI